MIALIDCNNFYVSCERLFNPKLINKPVAVLSNNDGCIIARSQEVKDIGVPMGAPVFKWQHVLRRHKVQLFSSNFALYGDISHRIMQTIQQFSPSIEIYSIDEAFLSVNHIDADKLQKYAEHMRVIIKQWTGIPVSIGVAPTKTLAKIANRYAKKYASCRGVFIMQKQKNYDYILKTMSAKDVWGIGYRYMLKLKRKHIKTAFDLKNTTQDSWIKKNLTINGLRAVWELRGIPCLTIEEQYKNKKAIACTRSFGTPIIEKEKLAQALALYVTNAAEKMRKQKNKAYKMHVFIMTSKFSEDHYYNSMTCSFEHPTDYTPRLIYQALQALHTIYRYGYTYKKAGIILSDFVENTYEQTTFLPVSDRDTKKQEITMHTLDIINKKWGRNTAHSARLGAKPQ